MTENVNYEDNLFYLSRMIGLVEESLKLKLDRDLFSERILGEIRFIDKGLQKIFKDLSDNRYLINRNQYLHSLMKKKNRFSLLMDELQAALNGAEIEETQEEARLYTRLKEVHKGDIADIREILSLSDDLEEEQDIISNDELNFLMAPGLLVEEEDS